MMYYLLEFRDEYTCKWLTKWTEENDSVMILGWHK